LTSELFDYKLESNMFRIGLMKNILQENLGKLRNDILVLVVVVIVVVVHFFAPTGPG